MTQSFISDLEPLIYPPMGRRRVKAAVMAIAIWTTTIALHLVSWGIWLALLLTLTFGTHTFRLLFAKAQDTPQPLPQDAATDAHPFVSLLVSAKNEEAVIGDLVRSLDRIDYPQNRLELWVVDDNSTDRTYEILQTLKPSYPQLKIYRRPASAQGGKSGALNDVLPRTQGEILGVFDADAMIA
ncbi:MAG: glycosyltransferase family 2 protein, partial [Cyanobacteria bacterium P01_F01_bin.42]